MARLALFSVLGMAFALAQARHEDVARANGFTTPIAAGSAGTYHYTVGVWPHPPTVGLVHVAIVLDSDDGRPATGATVEVWGRNDQMDVELEPRPAFEEFFSPGSYELNLTIDVPGRWVLSLAIEDSMGREVVQVPLDVGEGSEVAATGPPSAMSREQDAGSGGVNWAVTAGALVGVALIALGAWAALRR